MQTIQAQLQTAFAAAIKTAFDLEADPAIGLSQNPQFGDYQSNASMGLAKLVSEKTGQKTNPRQVAEKIKASLNLGDIASEVSIAGPGFINVRLNPAWLTTQINTACEDPQFGMPASIAPQTIVVDYSGVNIAKAMHVGHYRGTIVGDAFARILAFLGHRVIRQNHIGDWGLQMGMVTYAIETAGGQELSLLDLERLYKKISKDSEEPEVRRQMAERTRVLQQTPKDQLTAWKKVRELTMAAANVIYQRLGVLLNDDDVRGESSYSDQYGPLVSELVARGSAKETAGAIGLFPPGFKNRDGEPRPFIIQSRDGTFQYPTFDLAAIRYRVQLLKAERIIYTHDDRQSEHFAMLFATAHLLGWDTVNGTVVKFEYAPFGTILGEDGKPLKSRSGENIKLSDLLDEADERGYATALAKDNERLAKAKERGEVDAAPLPDEQLRKIGHSVGVGAVKYADLSKDRVSDYVFDWDKLISFEGNTAPYLQFVYARTKSIFRNAIKLGYEAGEIKLESPHELALAKHVLRFGEIIEFVAKDLKPHLLCTYLYELAAKYNGFYENCDVLKSEDSTRASRLRLIDVTAKTMALGLDLLGIEHPEQM